ncbi:MAG: hypothetical protein KC503_44950 [Myxococcales bacterium]|nr:hypothetical protein [Myxococcales bacterium]
MNRRLVITHVSSVVLLVSGCAAQWDPISSRDLLLFESCLDDISRGSHCDAPMRSRGRLVAAAGGHSWRYGRRRAHGATLAFETGEWCEAMSRDSEYVRYRLLAEYARVRAVRRPTWLLERGCPTLVVKRFAPNAGR